MGVQGRGSETGGGRRRGEHEGVRGGLVGGVRVHGSLPGETWHEDERIHSESSMPACPGRGTGLLNQSRVRPVAPPQLRPRP